MGQKAHPYGLRLGYIKPWKARWFASGRDLAKLLAEDIQIRTYLKKKLGHAGISSVEIDRSSGRVRVRIFASRPGVIIGRRGQEIDKVREDLSKVTGKELFLDIKEVKEPQIDAQLVAENIALQLQKRIGFRRAMKKAIQTARAKGALGIKVLCKGRLGGSEIARHEKYHDGKVPLSTFRANVDYGFAEAHTTYGSIGCKVWIYTGDILVKKEEAEQRAERQKKQEEFEKSLTHKVEKEESQDTETKLQTEPAKQKPVKEKEQVEASSEEKQVETPQEPKES